MTDKQFYYQHPEHGICLTWAGLLWLGFNEATLRGASYRGSKVWGFIEHPEDKRMVLVPFENLKKKYQEEISQKLRQRMGCKHDAAEHCSCGDLSSYTAKEPIRKMIRKDMKAESFYLGYKYQGPRGMDTLPADKVKQYTYQASLLNMLIYVEDNQKEVIKKTLKISVDKFYSFVKDVIESEKSKGTIGDKFPSSYRRLQPTIDEYRKSGYASLIHGNYGKQNAAKINDEVSLAVLHELIANPLQYDDWTVQVLYNHWAATNSYKTIDVSTVGVHRRNSKHLLIREREGNASLVNNVIKQINGYRPSVPFALFEHDDNHIDWLFTDWEDGTQHRHYHRMKSIIVSDSHCDLALGIAFGEKLTSETVRAAYADAMYYIKSITGGWYLPHEIKADRWAVTELEPFYKSMGHFFRTPVGSKGRGYIEQMFGSAHFKRCLKIGSNNYTGNNITAKSRGVNTEWLNANKKDYPTVQEAPQKVAEFMHRLRHLPMPNGKTKEQQWLEAFEKMPAEKRKPITDEQFLLTFGIEHKPHGRSNSITTGGIECQIRGIQYRFSVPEQIQFANIGKSVSIIYDPIDMSRVLVTDHDKIRFVATSPVLQPRAMADYKTGDRTFLNALLEEKRKTVEIIGNYESNRKQVLRDNFIDPETLLQTNFMVKELKQQAETQAIMINNGDSPRNDPWDQA